MDNRKALALAGTLAAIDLVAAGVLSIVFRSQLVTAHPQGGAAAGVERHYSAGLQGANLTGVQLRGASLRGADLRHANFTDASLERADLRNADLRDAQLLAADLRHANLRGADLRGACLLGRGPRCFSMRIVTARVYRRTSRLRNYVMQT